MLFCFFFFFQAEDGIRDKLVTGVQTCALPICALSDARWLSLPLGGTILVSNWIYVLLGVASFSIKSLTFCFLFMQLRWTLPRFRYDQLMSLGWKGLFPISVANVVVTAILVTYLGGVH